MSVDQKDYYCVDLELPSARSGPTRELFMLDTAATSSLLTPKAAARLGTAYSISKYVKRSLLILGSLLVTGSFSNFDIQRSVNILCALSVNFLLH